MVAGRLNTGDSDFRPNAEGGLVGRGSNEGREGRNVVKLKDGRRITGLECNQMKLWGDTACRR